MENKHVGLLIIGIGIIVGILVLIFNLSLKEIAEMSCSHGPECTMYNTMNSQLWISLSVTLIILVIGFVVMFTKPKEKIIVRTQREKKKKLNLEGLDKNEKRVIEIIQEENGAIFQRTLMEKLEIGKVGITRLLDKLESKELIERKRRGMNNIVVLKS